jgi:hypothetical protein
MSGPIAAPTTWKFSKRMFCTTPLGGVSRDSSEGRGGDEPSAAAGKTSALVRGLRNQVADPGFDVCGIGHVVVVGEDLRVFYKHVGYGAVFEVLAETAYCDAVSAVAGYLFSD